jgi:lambda family phage minor tail protein L
MTAIESVAQSLNPGAIVSLYLLDTSSIGGPVLNFVQGTTGSAKIVYGGVTYEPIDLEMTGFEMNGSGALPTPRVKISNTNGVVQSIINTYGDLLGCKLQRIRTFDRFLDGQPEADAAAFYGPDVFNVERKVSENPIYVEWELSAAIDQEGKELPGRHIIRDTCLWRYRVYNQTTGTFNYSKAQCPYTASAYYTKEGIVTTAPNDQCGRKISDCKLRFGASNPLPFGGFPGVARMRQ